MKTKIIYNGLVVASKKNAKKVLLALEKVGVRFPVSEIAREVRLPVSTVWDFWRRFEKDNDVEVVVMFNSKGRWSKRD